MRTQAQTRAYVQMRHRTTNNESMSLRKARNATAVNARSASHWHPVGQLNRTTSEIPRKLLPLLPAFAAFICTSFWIPHALAVPTPAGIEFTIARSQSPRCPAARRCDRRITPLRRLRGGLSPPAAGLTFGMPCTRGLSQAWGMVVTGRYTPLLPKPSSSRVSSACSVPLLRPNRRHTDVQRVASGARFERLGGGRLLMQLMWAAKRRTYVRGQDGRAAAPRRKCVYLSAWLRAQQTCPLIDPRRPDVLSLLSDRPLRDAPTVSSPRRRTGRWVGVC